MSGYHKRKIKRGVYGEVSKIREELEELEDAEEQDSSVLALVELSDMIGAIRGYLENHHPTISLYDLIKLADGTKRCFESGKRK